jgi:putative PIN family toxin of toxin-antitoxin system
LGASDGAYQLVVSAALLDELRRKLNEPKLRDPLTKVGLTPDAAVAFIAAIAIHVEPLPVTAPALRDPSDLHVLAAASGADVIVSRDKDLLSLGTFEGTPVMSVGDCLHTLGLHG